MNAREDSNSSSKNQNNKLLAKSFAEFEKSIQELCIKLATIQHVFSDEEFSELMTQIESLEAAAIEKKKIIGS